LPDDDSLVQTFRRMKSVLKSTGGFYLFDFGLLKSAKTRGLFVAEVARLAPPLTAHDYSESLKAAFPIDWVGRVARQELGEFRFGRSALVDICYFLQTPARTASPVHVKAYLDKIWAGFSISMKMEHLMLRGLRRWSPPAT
jgi:hypothetical protein